MSVYLRNIDGTYTCVTDDIIASESEQTIREGLSLDASICSQQILSNTNLTTVETNVIEDNVNE